MMGGFEPERLTYRFQPIGLQSVRKTITGFFTHSERLIRSGIMLEYVRSVLGRGNALVVRECRNCGAPVDDDRCPECGHTEIVSYEID